MTGKKEKKKSNIRVFILGGLAVVLLLAGFLLMPTLHFSVKGNDRIPREDVLELVFPKWTDRIYRKVVGLRNEKVECPVFESVSVKPKGIFCAEITVEEAEGAFRVLGGGEQLVFNVNGIRIPETENADSLPLLEGFTVRSCGLYGMPELSGESEKLFRESAEVFRVIHALKVPASVLTAAEDKFLLTFGSVHVNLGSGRYMTEKITEVSAQYPKYEGLKGTLHMENYDGSNKGTGFYFTVE